eukprot:scaffold317824_cov40-Tisochrysis_lutea.AAC.1
MRRRRRAGPCLQWAGRRERRNEGCTMPYSLMTAPRHYRFAPYQLSCEGLRQSIVQRHACGASAFVRVGPALEVHV